MDAALQVLAGVVGGYVAVSVCESFFHRVIQHAPSHLRAWYGRAGVLGRALIEAWYAHHVVHHHLTFRRDHVTQFADDHERARLDARLAAAGKDDVIACRHGTILGHRPIDYARYVGPALPLLLVLCGIGGGWFSLGLLVPLSVWPMLAQVVHPYLHMRHAEVIEQAPPVMRMLADTRWFRFLARHHWLHHRYGDCNFNLMPGGDIILGVNRRASPADLEAMRRVGLAVPQQEQSRAIKHS